MENLDQVIFYKLENAVRMYRQFAQKQIRDAGFAITIDQWLTVKNILENPGIKQQELAEKVFKDAASITRIIELLVKAKYLRRKVHRKDRRRTELVVTDLGKKVISEVSEVVVQYRAAALTNVKDDELLLINKITEMIVDNCS